MADLTDILIKRQENKYNRDQFGAWPDLMTEGNWNAGNYQQMISQGLGNLLGSINAPAQREAMARQEAIQAEQTRYDREQDSIANNLALKSETRAQTKFDNALADKALTKVKDNNSNLFALNSLQEVQGAFDQYRGAQQGIQAGVQNGIYSMDEAGNLVATENATKEQADALTGFQTLQEKQNELKASIEQRILKLNSDNDSSNDVNPSALANIQNSITAMAQGVAPTQSQVTGLANREQALTSKYESELQKIVGGTSQELLNKYEAYQKDPNVAGANVVNQALKNAGFEDAEKQREVLSEISNSKDSLLKDAGLEDVSPQHQEFLLARAIELGAVGEASLFSAKFGRIDNVNMVRALKKAYNEFNQMSSKVDKKRQLETEYTADMIKNRALSGIVSGKIGTY
ncbi:hypothetical protein NVP1238A_39 [Vibrio phage 1.238.A._10N.261.52.F10]|uniref:Uncharacterized protein n=1 Tax=Vibrio phage 1.238.A._10N.261.52.F10 TaxID=1881231 RepID=A0A2I7RUF9_9CAUD|nr:hypothetical protein KNT79_gp39 [Vibrio phage 1.238.A._10N.261.52.F10]AUR97288.1 hypothetical protein NVP1238A_39 [Vibrio phage 1.238.A._10N.261.52.F10]AUR97382.1 hypothetical protein NVP1238B_40 [Vibrio phage 1.238.B._10N.261.52.F10]